MAICDQDLAASGPYRLALEKPDGRKMWLYARAPIDPSIRAVAPSSAGAGPGAASPHLRWHPLRGEWIAYAGHRQNRTFLPVGFDPLSPTSDPSRPTELPEGAYDVAVFENLFPTFKRGATDEQKSVLWTAPARGACEVVVFTKEASGSLGALSLERIELVLAVWADRTAELGRRPEVQYVFPFENRGVEIGVTLAHPHGQIYAYPFVPPVPARALDRQREHYEATGHGLLEDLIVAETAEGRRILHQVGSAVAFVPACARYPFEIWAAPSAPAETLATMSDEARRDLAAVLKRALLLLDGLWKKPMPYILAVYQAPTDGRPHPEAHAHIEIYPYLRMAGRMKHLAGSEIGAGVFTADTLPEETADQLRAVVVEP